MDEQVLPDRKDQELHLALLDAGLDVHKQGASCTIYRVPGTDRKYLYVSWNHIDLGYIRLPAVFPKRGELLAALQLFWFNRVICGESNHLIAWGKFIYDYLPLKLRLNSQLHRQAFLVRAHHVSSVEHVAYGYLVKDLWSKYSNNGASELSLPHGLRYGARLRQPIVMVGESEVANDTSHPCLVSLAARAYNEMASHVRQRRLVMPFCRFRFGVLKIIPAGEGCTFIPAGVLAGQPGTPDTSEFYDASWRRMMLDRGEEPITCDRHALMEWTKDTRTPFFKHSGLTYLNSDLDSHRDFASRLKIPHQVVSKTMHCLRCLFQRITGESLERFQESVCMN